MIKKIKLPIRAITLRHLVVVVGGEPDKSGDMCVPDSVAPYACSNGCRTLGPCPLETFVGPCG